MGIPQDRTGWMWAAGIGLLMASSGHFVDLFLGGEFRGPPLETLAYQFTMPGLAEEPLYRGILLALFNRHFARKWSCFQVKMGWGAVFSALIFALVHVVTFSFKEQAFVLNMGAFIYPFLGGLVFAWIREKTGSIWPAVLAHNFANGFYHLGRWIVSGSSL
ncbi:MAG: CPBP family intramembrane metalloprotease [Verrucomicrobia bacterium]|nr:CPBP family intramembrane metalloprotease [Verrucomicrobiota bacterium]